MRSTLVARINIVVAVAVVIGSLASCSGAGDSALPAPRECTVDKDCAGKGTQPACGKTGCVDLATINVEPLRRVLAKMNVSTDLDPEVEEWRTRVAALPDLGSGKAFDSGGPFGSLARVYPRNGVGGGAELLDPAAALLTALGYPVPSAPFPDPSRTTPGVESAHGCEITRYVDTLYLALERAFAERKLSSCTSIAGIREQDNDCEVALAMAAAPPANAKSALSRMATCEASAISAGKGPSGGQDAAGGTSPDASAADTGATSAACGSCDGECQSQQSKCTSGEQFYCYCAYACLCACYQRAGGCGLDAGYLSSCVSDNRAKAQEISPTGQSCP